MSWSIEDIPEHLKARIEAQDKKAIQTPTPLAKSARKSKYGNIKTIIDNITFDSKKEADRYAELKHYEWANEIIGLELQPVFQLQEPFVDSDGVRHRAITYKADFRYKKFECGKYVEYVEDVKSSKTFTTDVYKIKKKMLLFKYRDIIFREVY